MKRWIKDLYIYQFTKDDKLKLSINDLRFQVTNKVVDQGFYRRDLQLTWRFPNDASPTIQEAINAYKGDDDDIIKLEGIWW